MFQRQRKAAERAERRRCVHILGVFIWAQGEQFCDCHPGLGGVLKVGWRAAQKIIRIL